MYLTPEVIKPKTVKRKGGHELTESLCLAQVKMGLARLSLKAGPTSPLVCM